MIRGFTPHFQNMLTGSAQRIGRKNNSDKLEPEHLVLSMLEDKESLAYKALVAMSVDTDDMFMEITKSVKNEAGTYRTGDLPHSRRTKWLLDSAAKEARAFNQDQVGSEHVLFAAISEVGSPSYNYVSLLKLNMDIFRRVIFELNKKSGYLPASSSQQDVQKDSSKPGSLSEFCIDLTQKARDGEIDPIFGREEEIERTIRILSRRNKNNPVLVGEPGVGKTAIVEGLASQIVNGDVPDIFKNKRILTLDIASMIAGTKYRGEFEGRFKKLIKEIKDNGEVILFIDELHSIIGAGGAEGAIDASTILKPSLSRGDIRCIGATTLDEYKKHVEKDSALDRRFQQVLVEEPGKEDCMKIISGLCEKYGEHHKVVYSQEAIEAAVSLSNRYITDRYQPDKAIDLLDEAGALKKLSNSIQPKELRELEEHIEKLSEEKTVFVKNQNYEKAARLRDEVLEMRKEIEELKNQWQSSVENNQSTVSVDDVYSIISELTGIPSTRFEQDEMERLLKLEEYLRERVVGQEDAVSAVSSSVRRARTGITNPNRPLGSFIFLGPTGVGKTLLAKTLAEFLFGDESALIRIDMSDYMEKHNVSRLVGAPPGYVGYDEGGFLTDKIRRKPYSVILLDEIEKAHTDVFNLLLQILEEGELQDSSGRTISFKNTVIIMTSNAGAREIVNVNSFGFVSNDGGVDQKSIKSSALVELKRLFRPEFLNRVDDTIVFKALTMDDIGSILDILIKELSDRMEEMGIELAVSEEVRQYLMEKQTYEKAYGARPLRRILLNNLEDPLSVEILKGNIQKGVKVSVDLKDNKVDFNFRS